MQRCPLCRRQMLSCGCRFDEDRPIEAELTVPSADLAGRELAGADLFVDANGCIAERRRYGDGEVVIHYDDLPDGDVTVVHGIRCTTALRTVIDLAPSVQTAHLEVMVEDCLRRRLFTLEEAWSRLSQPDMLHRPGAELLRQVLRTRR